MNKNDFYTAIENRRSIYGISSEAVVSNERIQEVINHAVKHTPSSFNSQTARVVVLTGESHTKLWNITTETLRKIVPAENFGPTEDKMNAFGSGYGTVLFFEDNSAIEGLQKQFPLYAENFPIWSLQSNGMLQHVIWTSLELEGFGASLQHYNPLIDDEVKKEWNIPSEWKLLAQMPFGKPTAPAGEKQFAPLEDRVKFYN
ncbi:nitroreductase family protein [Heyndrickxia sporothermodurans]|uniref:nitroreductase family protein n=1 Tax=Heyndrickxia sporothermodurans TaxID=46224 RepID=UPI000D3BDE82|nr:nitroreductase family protein [Heyndrickxia sporothermodurans]MBL5766354.1 nitroreductase family protein [Heyndrickxia sporothermodurans]MBL5769793.1 nitroreductase family protein [Heyndrickxia sporothermodurans]MBL5773985.1 nitroreductase family protein [Heyndrickxia sporothermodurans]MBL5776873.1 nitroreductase family protein [Heyndrickxia sporothermodurans]MBL5781277.1 nitroreductase family protein [Heyndrickxia sporothermodurans]